MKLLISIAILLGTCADASSEYFGDFMDDYLPYLDGKSWPRFPVIAYTQDNGGTWIHPSDPKQYPGIDEYHEEDSDFSIVRLRLPDGAFLRHTTL